MVTLIFFGSTLSFAPFIFDDYFHIFDNTTITSRGLKGFVFYLTKSLTPIPFLLWKFIALFNINQDPAVYRLLNFIFHALNTYLVFSIARDLFKDKIRVSWFVAFVYLLHPAQVESVVWISSLRGLTATFFALLFIKDFLINKKRAFFFFMLGILCKPTMVVSLPFALLIYYYHNGKWPEKGKASITVGALLSAFFFFLHKANILSANYNSFDFLVRLKLTVSSVSLYLINLFFPFRLTFDYQMNPFTINYLEDTGELMPLLLVAPLFLLILFGLLLKNKKQPLALFGISFLILLTPHIGLILHDFNNISVVSDRYLNLPLLGYSLFLGQLGMEITQYLKKKYEYLSPYIHHYLILGLLASLCLHQGQKWNNPITLLEDSNRFMETREATLLALANQYQNQGDFKNAREAAKNALATNLQSSEALKTLMKLNELSPEKKEEDYIIHHVQSPYFTMTSQFYLPLIRLYLKRKNFTLAQNLIQAAIAQKIHLKEIYFLKESLQKARKEEIVASYRKLEIYFKFQRDFKNALFYCEKILELNPMDEHALKRREDYLFILKSLINVKKTKQKSPPNANK